MPRLSSGIGNPLVVSNWQARWSLPLTFASVLAVLVSGWASPVRGQPTETGQYTGTRAGGGAVELTAAPALPYGSLVGRIGDGERSPTEDRLATTERSGQEARSNLRPALGHGGALAAAERWTALLVREAEGGRDLNGDGDTADAVVHVLDAKEDTTINLGLAAASVCTDGSTPPSSTCQPVLPEVNKELVDFLVGESEQGGAHLNDDGDASDDVLYTYDAEAGRTTNTRLVVAQGVGRSVSSYTFPIRPVVAEGVVAFLVGESEQGGADLNQDGDAGDAVLHVRDAGEDQTTNLKLAAATNPGPFGSHNPISPEVQGQRLNFLVGESEQGGQDLDGDGDASDQVLYVFQLRSGKLKLVSGPDKR